MTRIPAVLDPPPAAPAAPLSDDAVIARIRAGDSGAYAILMRRYNQRLFRAARSIVRDDGDAQDAVQEAYVRAWFHLDRYAPGTSFGAWLTRIAVNEALMSKRRHRHEIPGADGNADALRGGEPLFATAREEPAEALARGQLRALIERAIDRLPPAFRTVFALRAVQQLSVQETAASLELPENTVKTRYHRARKLMQQMVEADLSSAEHEAFRFDGDRCDAIVHNVMARIHASAGYAGRRR